MINRLVLANLKSRPLRTLLSAVAIGVQVTMVLTLVGISRGTVEDGLQRARGVGADVMIRPPGSSLFSFSSTFPEKILLVAQRQPDVAIVTGTLIQPIGGVDSVTGIDLGRFNAMSGGFRFLEGGPFLHAGEVLVDEYYAQANHLRAGKGLILLNRSWKVAGVVEAGKMSCIFVELPVLQDLTANTGRLSVIYQVR